MVQNHVCPGDVCSESVPFQCGPIALFYMMVFYKQKYLEVYKAFLIFRVKLRIVVSLNI